MGICLFIHSTFLILILFDCNDSRHRHLEEDYRRPYLYKVIDKYNLEKVTLNK